MLIVAPGYCWWQVKLQLHLSVFGRAQADSGCCCTQMLDLTADLKSRLDHFKAGLDGVFYGPVIRDAERALRDCCQLITGAYAGSGRYLQQQFLQPQ